MRILVVDDKPEGRYLFQTLLSKSGHEVIPAGNGVEAVEKLESHPVDLIISDVLMPRMDGYQLCMHCKNDERLRGVPFILHSAEYGDPEDERFGRNLGADEYIVGPVDPQVIVGVVAAAARRPGKEEKLGLSSPAVLLEHNRILLKMLEKKMAAVEAALSSLRLAVEAGNVGCWHWDIRTDESQFSPRWKSQLGFAEDEIAARHEEWVSRLHPQDRERVLAAVDASLRVPWPPYVVEYRLRHKDGSYRWISSRGEVQRGSDGMPMLMRGVHVDVTERKNAELRLTEERNRAQRYLDVAEVMFVVLDVEGRITLINRKGAQILGDDEQKLVGLNWFETFLAAETRDPAWKAFQGLVATETRACQDRQELIVTRKGERRLLVFNDCVLTDTEGRVSGLLSSAEDITDRQRAERQRDRFFSLSKDMLCIVDVDGSIRQLNKAWQEALGWTGEELLSKPLVELAHPDDRNAMEELLRRAAEEGSSGVQENRLLCKNGTYRWISWSGSFEMAERLVYAAGRDITREKEREAKLLEQAELLHIAQDAISVRDLEDRVLFWSSGAERLFGWTAGEIVGRRLQELLEKEAIESLQAPRALLLQNGSWRGELHLRTKSGESIYVDSRWSLVRDESDNPKAVLSVSTDITEKKQIEAQLLRTQRLESLGALASGIAHDLNNVLTPILMGVDFLRASASDATGLPILSIMYKSARRGAEMVKQVLTFARGSQGERGEIQLRHVLRDMETVVTHTFPRSIEVVARISKDLWAVVGDATQIEQAIMNLCVNARDAMPDGGVLTVEAENLLIDEALVRTNPEAHAGPYVVVSVRDTGTGIPAGIVPKIFEPFFTTKDPGKGTGLGLATVQSIARSHEGFVSVYTEVGTEHGHAFPPVFSGG